MGILKIFATGRREKNESKRWRDHKKNIIIICDQTPVLNICKDEVNF